jgi:solute carrier family 6 (neurotransmitter transporter)
MALGHFLGQASAHTWKASPFFKGAAIIGHLGSLLKSIWITMQSSLIVLYMIQILTSQVPFTQCPSSVYRNVREIQTFNLLLMQ